MDGEREGEEENGGETNFEPKRANNRSREFNQFLGISRPRVASRADLGHARPKSRTSAHWIATLAVD